MKLHSRRVAALAATFCQCLELPAETESEFVFSAYMHDVGKAAIPKAILGKPGRLTQEEEELLRSHTTIGAQILHESGHSRAALDALHHHEAWDGSGYPHGLKGEQIPFSARLIALCDVYAALREDRSYREGLSHRRAIELMQNGDRSGHASPEIFDPSLLKVFLRHHRLFDAANTHLSVSKTLAAIIPTIPTHLHDFEIA